MINETNEISSERQESKSGCNPLNSQPFLGVRHAIDIVSNADLINYNPEDLVKHDVRKKSLIQKISHTLSKNFPYLVGILILIQVLIPEVKMLGKEKS